MGRLISMPEEEWGEKKRIVFCDQRRLLVLLHDIFLFVIDIFPQPIPYTHIKHHKLYPPWTFDRPNIITFVIYRWISRGIRRVCVRTVSSMNDFYCYRIIPYNPLRLLILLINDISWKATVLQSREDLDRYQNQWRNVKVSVENWLWNRWLFKSLFLSVLTSETLHGSIEANIWSSRDRFPAISISYLNDVNDDAKRIHKLRLIC